MNILGLNYNVETHKYLEILKGGDKTIVLFSDDGTTINKETHQFHVCVKDNGIVEAGMVICTITKEQATGTWEERYTLNYESLSDQENTQDSPTNN